MKYLFVLLCALAAVALAQDNGPTGPPLSRPFEQRLPGPPIFGPGGWFPSYHGPRPPPPPTIKPAREEFGPPSWWPFEQRLPGPPGWFPSPPGPPGPPPPPPPANETAPGNKIISPKNNRYLQYIPPRCSHSNNT